MKPGVPAIYAVYRLPNGEWLRVDRDPAELACVWRKSPMTQRSSVDREPRRRSVTVRRADGRRRWHAWADRRRNGKALVQVEYDATALGKLILKG